jgi:site-specific DNA recombinase
MHSSSGKVLRAAWYSRVSGEGQVEAVTIDLQRDYATRFFALHQDSLTLVGTYEDDGVSGAIPVSERPGGKRLLADAQAGKFDVIVFYSFDRIVRSTLDLLQFHQVLQEYGVELRSATQPFDTTTAFGRAFMTLLAMVAELERHQIQDRTTRGRLRAIQNNRGLVGPITFGYRALPDGSWEVNEEEAEVVRLIYKMLIEGGTTFTVAEWLTTHHIPPIKEARGRALSLWRPSTIGKLIRRTTYRGTYYYNTTRTIRNRDGKIRRAPRPESEWVSAQVPPIVSEEVWYAAQAALERNKSRKKKDTEYYYLLRRILRCDVCGLAYIGNASGRKGAYHYYYRHANRAPGYPRCIGIKTFPAKRIEALIWEEVESFVREPNKFIGRLRSRLQLPTSSTPSPRPIPNHQERIERKVAARASVIRMLARELITEDEAERELLQLEGELRELEAERDAQATQAFATQHSEARLLEAEHLLERLRQSMDNPDSETKYAIIHALVQEIRLAPGRDKKTKAIIEVIYTFDPRTEELSP